MATTSFVLPNKSPRRRTPLIVVILLFSAHLLTAQQLGTISATGLLVDSTTTTHRLQLTRGAAAGFLLQSDASGEATWVSPLSVPNGNWTTSGSHHFSALPGNVGIGTNSPTEKLDLVGNFQISQGAILMDTGNIHGLDLLEGTHRLLIGAAPGVSSYFQAGSNGNFVVGSGPGDFFSPYKLWVEGGLRVQDNFSVGGAHDFNVDAINFVGGRFHVSASGNVGIGNNNPSQKLEVNGTVKAAGLQLAAGAVAGYLLQTDANGNATWTNPALLPNPSWTVSGSNQFSSLAGNVGIGTSNPTEKLEVAGITKTTDLQVTNGAVAGHVLQSDADGLAAWVDPSVLNNPYWASTLPGGSMFALVPGNVGIGTNNPTEKLDVGGKIKVSGGGEILLENSHIRGLNTLEGSENLYFRGKPGNPINLVIVGSSGNVGIGTSNPSQKLEVAGTTKTTDLQLTNGAVAGHVLQSDADGHAAWVSPSVLPDSNWVKTGPHLFSASVGNVGIGTSSPTEKLEVAGKIKLSGGGEILLENSHVKGINTLEGAENLHLRAKPGNPISLFIAGATANVGIGTGNPVEKLDIAGNIQLNQNSLLGCGLVQGSGSLTLKAFDNSPLSITLDLDNNLIFSNPSNNSSIFGVHALRGTPNGLHLQGDANSNSDLFIHPNGNVGIGVVPNPTERLHVNGALRVDERGGFRQIHSDVGLNVRSLASDLFIFNAEGATGINVLQVENDAEVRVFGNFFVANGSKNFVADHPLDPAHKTLQHACVESNQVINIYRGNILLDAAGEAWVQLPDYFEALNKDVSYQLTCIGGFAQVFIQQEVSGNRFRIAGGSPGLKVAWQVTGVRNDPWFRDHPYIDVQDKTTAEQGTYYYPEGYGQPAEKSMARLQEEESPQR